MRVFVAKITKVLRVARLVLHASGGAGGWGCAGGWGLAAKLSNITVICPRYVAQFAQSAQVADSVGFSRGKTIALAIAAHVKLKVE